MNITANEFPQLAAKMDSSACRLSPEGSLSDFRAGCAAVFSVPVKVTGVDLTVRGVRLACQAYAFENRLTHTHETAYTLQTPTGDIQSVWGGNRFLERSYFSCHHDARRVLPRPL